MSASGGLTVVVAGVSEVYQGDLDIGRLLVEDLAGRELPAYVIVEDFSYGAVAVTARLEELAADVLILVGAKRRGRTPGAIERRTVGELDLDAETVQVAVGDAGTGYLDLDLTIEVGWGLDALPPRVVVVEIEPADTSPGEGLSDTCRAAYPALVGAVLREVDIAPLFDLVAQVEPTLDADRLGDSVAFDAVAALVRELRGLDEHGTWGRSFAEKDRLRLAIAEGASGDGMTHADWGMWWGLIEEVTRLEQASVTWT